jgi:hypothetical protein
VVTRDWTTPVRGWKEISWTRSSRKQIGEVFLVFTTMDKNFEI